MFFRPFKSPDRFSDGAGEILLEKYDYDVDGNVTYQGATNLTKGSDDEDIWAIAKYTYVDGNISMIEYRYKVAWSERAIQDWI